MARRGHEGKTYTLEADQAAALDLLLAGKTITDAAAAVGVTRETVSRWRNKDAAFLAAYNAALQSLFDAGQARLLEARSKALDRLATLLDSKDEATALKAAAVLLRVTITRPTGRVDPADIDSWRNILGD